MSAKYRGGRQVSAESRTAEIEVLQAGLVAQVEALRSDAGWLAYLRGVRQFHGYSPNNVMLILLARPDATRVAGYRTWRRLGRQVRKGEKGIRIFGPREFTSTRTDERTGEEKTSRGVVFRPVSVFDISQTDPIEGASLVFEERPVTRLAGADEGRIFDRVASYLGGLGWTVSREVIWTGQDGYTTPLEGRRVVVDARLSEAHAASVIVHEAAHIVLGHIEALEDYRQHRGRFEVEAESTAYVVAGLLGLDTSASSTGYLAGWCECAPADVLKETAGRVLKAVQTLYGALEGACEVEPVEASETV